jgi:hypothetical protein
MRPGPRSIVAVLAFVLGLHVFMLAGLGHPDAGMPAGDGAMQAPAMASADLLTKPAPTWHGGGAQPPGAGHDMAATCLAVLAGMVLLGASLTGIRRRWTQERQRWPGSPVTLPASPPPIALGISRT